MNTVSLRLLTHGCGEGDIEYEMGEIEHEEREESQTLDPIAGALCIG